MKKRAIDMFKRAWGIIVSGVPTWDQIVAEKKSAQLIRKGFIYPWIFLTVFLTFVFDALYTSANPFQTGIVSMIIVSISLFGGYFLSNILCFAYLKKFQPELALKQECETVVAYSYIIIILIEILTIIIPSLFFLRILSMFVGYVVWEGSRAVWNLKEEDRGNIVLIFSIIIIFIPLIINRILHFMLPNT